MLLADALNAIIDDGIESVRQAYAAPADRMKRDGSFRGFEDCRGRAPDGIRALLAEARREAEGKRDSEAPDYWFWRWREVQVEWVANVLSAILHNEGLPPIVPPTARGLKKAADIVGVAGRPGP
jgi:hypothetical protein